MGLTPNTLFTACLLVIRNQRILDAFAARHERTQSRSRPAAQDPPPPARATRQPRNRTAITTAHQPLRAADPSARHHPARTPAAIPPPLSTQNQASRQPPQHPERKPAVLTC